VKICWLQSKRDGRGGLRILRKKISCQDKMISANMGGGFRGYSGRKAKGVRSSLSLKAGG